MTILNSFHLNGRILIFVVPSDHRWNKSFNERIPFRNTELDRLALVQFRLLYNARRNNVDRILRDLTSLRTLESRIFESLVEHATTDAGFEPEPNGFT